MKRAGIVASFRAAGWGLVHTVATQKHMKVHLVAAAMVTYVGMALPLDLASSTALLFCVALVFFAEILNSALEAFVDLHIKDFERGAMIAKDAAAAGVLVLALATVVVLADILWMHWAVVQANIPAVHRSLMFGLPLDGILIVMLWGPGTWWVRLPLSIAAVGFALPLWAHSTDPVYSIVLGALILLAAVARSRPNPASAVDSD